MDRTFASLHRIMTTLGKIGPQTFALTPRQQMLVGGLFGGAGTFAAVSLASIEKEREKETAPDFGAFRVERADSCHDTAHHVDGGGFANPWISFRNNRDSFALSFAKLMLFGDKKPPVPAVDQRVPTQHVDWTRLNAKAEPMLLTWLSHAAFLLTLPSAKILLDPCLSDRCSPFSFAGPQRLISPPCKLDELDPDIVVISHNHYDHLDLDVLKSLVSKKKDLLFFVPMGNKRLLVDAFFFGGDTGYRTVFQNEDEESVPTCPAFRQIREKFGNADLAALPIGAYNPRHLLSNVHCSPKDAVDVHRDLGAKKSVAMQWGTFVLSREDVMEPPRLLRQEMEKKGLKEDEFLIIDVGETVAA
ncbi:UNVERIFIED_CONTAM: hypothetical protein HDU68_005191 [Siphonaria sp. JEL0065]|nr:hypothetical protein HDU68_005191 [Siphonaria sp. JEL0065]